MMRRWLLWALLLPLFCAGFGAGARAQTSSPSCLVDYSDINFGDNIDILSNAAIAGVGNVTVQCFGLNAGQLARVCMGMNPAAFAPNMVNQVDNVSQLYYDIFTDAQHTQLWYSQLKKRPFVDVAWTKPTATIPFYGLIRSGQSTSPVGQYADLVKPPFRFFVYSSSATPPGCDASGYDGPLVTLTVRAKITPNCTFTSQPKAMDFKDPSGLTTVIRNDLFATTDLIFSCTTSAPYSVGLSPGNHNPSGGATTRRMCRIGDEVNCITYGLYADAAYGMPWGSTDPLASGSNSKPRKASSSGEKITVYGKMPTPDISPAPGYYSDQITVTVNF